MKVLLENEFIALKDAYAKENLAYDKAMIFHVGVTAGFYSEVGSLMECMIFCHLHQIRFILYSDDANFSDAGKGWREFFDVFCEENHDDLNHAFNRRRKEIYRVKGYSPRDWSKRIANVSAPIFRKLLKTRNDVDYLTSDFFKEFAANSDFKRSFVHWQLFGMNGTVYPEIAKLKPFVLRYNEHTTGQIDAMVRELSLPDHYVSIQIRGGDKAAELVSHQLDAIAAMGVDRCLETMEASEIDISAVFILTDDYRDVLEVKSRRPEWSVYTLTRPDERGYDNRQFSHRRWDKKRADLIKLFSAVEVCIASDLHFGYEHSNVNNIIKPAKRPQAYISWVPE